MVLSMGNKYNIRKKKRDNQSFCFVYIYKSTRYTPNEKYHKYLSSNILQKTVNITSLL